MKNKFTIIGGDERSIYLAESLLKDGKDVKVFGFDTIKDELKVDEVNTLEEAMDDTDVIIGPLPFSRDGTTINAMFSSKTISIIDVFEKISKNQILIIGKGDEHILDLAREKEVHVEDYFLREEMQILNAIPTAEGAIQVAMRDRLTTIHGSNILIIGFGRIGKVLGKMLNGIGANTFVVARKYSDLAWIKTLGYTPVSLEDISKYLSDMDIIFNTVPSMVLNEDLLIKLKKDSLVIDLASKPGGVDFLKAKQLGIKVKWELGVPGKAAPVSAGDVVKETVYNIIDELGESR